MVFRSKKNTLYECNPGGAPCNVLSMLSKLERSTAFVGKIGDDMFGKLLEETLISVGINTSGLIISPEENTTLAFVKIDENGDRDFAFYRNPGADMKLNEQDINEDLISNSKIFHFGTLSMTHEGVRAATKKAIEIARNNKILISFDPNYREPLWESETLAREQMLYGCSVCNILKIEDEELLFMLECNSVDEGITILKEKFDIKVIMITAGTKGSRVLYKGIDIKKRAFLNKNTVDTTGAGDTFCACCLNTIIEEGIENLNEIVLLNMLTVSNAAASIVTTKKGAILSMPTLKEVHEYIKKFN